MNKYNQPDAVDKTDTKVKPVRDWQEQLCKLGMDEWHKGQSYVDDLNDTFEDMYNMIRGIRPEKQYSWQSNVVINKVFQVVWTTIPYLTQKIFGATPVIGVKSYDAKGAWQREEMLEFWHTMQPTSDHTSYFLISVMWILRALLNGVGILKKTWHQKLKNNSTTISTDIPLELDEQGRIIRSETFKQTFRDTIPTEDWPKNVVVNNRDLVSDWLLQPGQSIRQGRFIIHREMTDLAALYASDINYMNLDDIDPLTNMSDSTLRQDHDDFTNIDDMQTTPDSDVYADVEVYERVGQFPVYKKKKDGNWMPCFDKEKAFDSDDVVVKDMICTWSHGKNDVLIRFDENKYGEINYIDIHIYFDAERWHSMGQVEPFKDIQTALNDNINAAFDEIWQNLMPPVVVNKFALWDWDTMQYAPGQRWLVGGPPADSIYFKEPSNITRDSWQKHALLDNEIQLTSSITPPMHGMGKEKAATTNVLNAQMSAGKLDFIIKMIEQTGLIPSAQMDVRFAKKFAHPKTFQFILGQPFEYNDFEELYRYIPCAASVKLEYQRNMEIQQDLQLMQIVAGVQNPNMPAIMNVLWANILRNRNMPKEAAKFDEEYFSPDSESGNMQMLQRSMAGATSNQAGLPMTGPEQETRRIGHEPRR